MHTVQDLWNSALTYATVVGSYVIANQQGIITFLSLLLLVARLVHDLPKAFKTVKRWFTKND